MLNWLSGCVRNVNVYPELVGLNSHQRVPNPLAVSLPNAFSLILVHRQPIVAVFACVLPPHHTALAVLAFVIAKRDINGSIS